LRLLTHIENLAREREILRLEADFYEGNTAAEVLYLKKLNYEKEGVHRKAILLNDGKYVNKISIGKILILKKENKKD